MQASAYLLLHQPSMNGLAQSHFIDLENAQGDSWVE